MVSLVAAVDEGFKMFCCDEEGEDEGVVKDEEVASLSFAEGCWANETTFIFCNDLRLMLPPWKLGDKNIWPPPCTAKTTRFGVVVVFPLVADLLVKFFEGK